MNILGIDYGTKRIGLAWMQTGIDVVLPFGRIQNLEPCLPAGRFGILNTQLIDVIKKEKVDRVVVGLPLGLDGKENENTARVRKFGDALARETGIAVEYHDERFTTREAAREEGGVSPDEAAAMLILESYRKKHGI